jgi:predicted dehydrogenase
MTRAPLRVAFIGAGLFARDAHVPNMLTLPELYEPVAVYSRTRESAEQLVAAVGKPMDITTDLDAILSRDDIDVFDVTVTINLLPEFVKKALATGKHVISEKPVAPTVAQGRELLKHTPTNAVWMVAENWRYIQSFLAASTLLNTGTLGKPIQMHWATAVKLDAGNKYYGTDWRRAGDFPGGFLLDGGVHNIAALRLLLGEISRVSAFTAQVREDLPPTDTLAATFRFDNGALGTYTTSFAAPAGADTGLTIVCENGSLRIQRDQLEIIQAGQTDRHLFSENGIRDELVAFAEAILDGKPHHNSAAQALQDVAIIEAILKSGPTGESVTPERIV